MEYRLDEAVQVLARTPWVLTAMLDGLDEVWTEADEGPDTFSPYEIVGHLLHGERTDWMPRARIILEGREGTFEPYDRFAQRKESKGRSLSELLVEFSEARQENLHDLQALGLQKPGPQKPGLEESRFELRGVHPALGRVTLRQLLSAWVAHDLGHLAQAARVMAKRYREEVGPWLGHLPVLSDREP